jgi:hypothetical protein
VADRVRADVGKPAADVDALLNPDVRLFLLD